MVPAPNGDCGRSDDAENAPRADGGEDLGFDEAALYAVVRKAVEDAILGAIGTLLLVGVAFAIVWFGIAMLAQASSPLRTALGGATIVFGLYVAAATLELVPPAREWF